MNPKQQRFVQEYLIDSNATQAAIRAGYSARSAETTASRMLRNGKVAAAVETGRAKIAEKIGVTAERVMAEYARIGFADIRKIFDANGNLLHPKFMDDETAAAIGEVRVSKKAGGETIHEIKRVDKKGALDSMARTLGMFQDKLDVNVTTDLAGKLDAARKRASK